MNGSFDKAFMGTLGVLSAISAVLLLSGLIHVAVRWVSQVDPDDAVGVLRGVGIAYGPVIATFLIVGWVIQRWLWRRY